MDLREEFENLLRKYGHNIYLQRRIYDTGSGIYQTTADPAHNYFSTEIEKYTVRMTFAGRKTALTDVAEERPEGIVHTVNRVWYFSWYIMPAEGDRIYEDDPRYTGAHETYLIDYAQPFRGHHGKIIFYEVGGTRESPN